MFTRVFKNEDEFTDDCICAYKLLKFADTVNTDGRWFFDVCYYNEYEESYSAIFKSYITEEYKDYVLSLKATLVDNEWDIKIIKKIDGLTRDTEYL